MFTLIMAWLGLVVCVVFVAWGVYELFMNTYGVVKDRGVYQCALEALTGKRSMWLVIPMFIVLPAIMIGLLVWAALVLARYLNLL